MIVKLYSTTDDYRKLNKTLLNEAEYDCILNNTVSFNNIEIKIRSSTTITYYNYCYIPDLHAYYFITNIKSVAKNVFILELKKDVLMTYKDLILNCYGVVKPDSYASTNTGVYINNALPMTDKINFDNVFPNEPITVMAIINDRGATT